MFQHVSPGGGGHGDPWERDPDLVLRDWLDERITAAHAREAYGVVLDTENRAIDQRSTEELRSRSAAQQNTEAEITGNKEPS